VNKSLCEKIAGTLNATDFDRFNAVYEDAEFRPFLDKSASVLDCLYKLTTEPVLSAGELEEMALKAASAPAYDVVQVRPDGFGYLVKFSAAPDNVAPQEVKMSAPEAQASLPQEALQTADEQGAATMTGVEAEPDPMEEAPPAPVDGFGLYKVFEAGSKKQLVGYVIPGLFDPRQGGSSRQSLFVNGGQYALQPAIVGNLVGMNFNLPLSDYIRGLGIFFKTNGRALMATVPYMISSEITAEGKKYYSAQDPQTGEELQITISDGLKKPIATSPTEIIIPADFSFLALDNEVQLEGGEGADVMAQQKEAAMPTMLEIRAWETGCTLSGPVLEKVGSGEYDWVEGLFWMAAAGVPQNMGVALLEKAASSGQPLRLYGCRPLSTVDRTVKEANIQAYRDMRDVVIPKRICLLKEATVLSMDKTAASMMDVDSVDSILALNFINPENVSAFVENLPQLEETASKLASLVFATQIGLQSVPKTAATRAMFALEDVITGLKSMKEYRI
jgi:hypothetical protein